MNLIIFLFLVFVPSWLCAEGPILSHSDTVTQQEFENVYQDIRSKNLNPLNISSGTIAILNVTTAAYFGDGTLASPSISFINDTDTGLRRSGTNAFEAVAGAVDVASFTSTGSSIRGTNTNNDADVGWVGEYVSTRMVAGASLAATQGSFGNIISTVITAGDWDVSGGVEYDSNGSTMTVFFVACSSFSANTQTDHVTGNNQIVWGQSLNATTTLIPTFLVGAWRITVAASTTIYLKNRTTVATGTPNVVAAFMRARRVR